MTEPNREQTILIVDDEPANIRILVDLLRPGYALRVATNGETALRIALSDAPPDLIILDVMMQGVNGYEVCSQLKNDPRTESIPVIFITAKGQERDEIRGLEAGAIDYVAKPFNPVIVKARVQTHAELKRHRDFLKNLSFCDGLTNIANRRRFDEYLTTSWDFACRESSPLSLILVDIDHFKLFNDTLGHQAGDECLRQVAQALQASLKRRVDLLARYGGEEFGCILPKTNLHGAVMIAERFRESILGLRISRGPSSGGCLTISQGAATIVPGRDFSPESLIKAADEALFRSKQEGRDRIYGIDLA